MFHQRWIREYQASEGKPPPARSRRLGSMIILGPLQLKIFYNSMIFFDKQSKFLTSKFSKSKCRSIGDCYSYCYTKAADFPKFATINKEKFIKDILINISEDKIKKKTCHTGFLDFKLL